MNEEFLNELSLYAYKSLNELFDSSREDFESLDIDRFDILYNDIETYISALEKLKSDNKSSSTISW